MYQFSQAEKVRPKTRKNSTNLSEKECGPIF